MPKRKHVVVIGAGFSGLSTAAYLAKAGFRVTILEKNNQPGGRAYTIKKKKFRFELGPSWYMMPDVFDEFFNDFGKSATNYYQLTRLDPAYRVFFDRGTALDLSDAKTNQNLFSSIEPAAGVELENYLNESERLYNSARQLFLNRSYKIGDLLHFKTLRAALIMPVRQSLHSVIKKRFYDHKLQKILEFMSVFLGTEPRKLPAFYGLLTYVDMKLGIWYPEGGFTKVAKSFAKHARTQGAVVRYNQEVSSIVEDEGRVTGVKIGRKKIACDVVVAATDYHHVETKLVSKEYQSYSPKYWSRKKLSPSALLFSFGINTRLPHLEHHNLFFDSNWHDGFKAVFKTSKSLNEPLFYVSMPSKTDPTVAPKDSEALFVLVPISNNQKMDKKTITEIKKNILRRLSDRAQVDIKKHIVAEDIRTTEYFQEMFNAYKNNAFGLSHTLRQSAFMRPRMQSKKLPNLFYAGQYTNPGTGVPLCVLSGKVVAGLVVDTIKP